MTDLTVAGKATVIQGFIYLDSGLVGIRMGARCHYCRASRLCIPVNRSKSYTKDIVSFCVCFCSSQGAVSVDEVELRGEKKPVKMEVPGSEAARYFSQSYSSKARSSST